MSQTDRQTRLSEADDSLSPPGQRVRPPENGEWAAPLLDPRHEMMFDTV